MAETNWKIPAVALILIAVIAITYFGYTGVDPTHEFKTKFRVDYSIRAFGNENAESNELFVYPSEIDRIIEDLDVGVQQFNRGMDETNADCFDPNKSNFFRLGCNLGISIVRGVGIGVDIEVYHYQWFQWKIIYEFSYNP